jgi:hypothetical protein
MSQDGDKLSAVEVTRRNLLVPKIDEAVRGKTEDTELTGGSH